MAESRKAKEYRASLHELARPRNERRRKELHGKSAKLGHEIYGEERKGKPRSEPGRKPR